MKRHLPPTLDEATCQDLRLALTRRQLALREELASRSAGASRVQHARDLLTQDGDDLPAHSSDREVDLALDDHERQELDAIAAALARLDEGRYGWCDGCGEVIAQARLQALPQADLCISCASQREAPANTLNAKDFA